LSVYASSAPRQRLTSSSLDQRQPDLAALEDISLRSTPVAVGDSSGIAKETSEAAKVAPVIIQIPRLIGTAWILYQCRGAVVGRRAALKCRQCDYPNCNAACQLTSTLYCDGQNAPSGQQTRYGSTVPPQSTSWLKHEVPFRRRANPEGDAAIVACLMLTKKGGQYFR